MTLPHRQPERRRVQRIALRLNATARERGRSRVPIRLVDISTHGCRIEMLGGSFVEDSIWLSVAGLEALQCRVAWHMDGFAGVEFITPLSETILDSLLVAHRNSTEAVVRELRELANRTHRSSTQAQDNTEKDPLLEFSRDCSVQAIVHGLQLGATSSAEAGRSQLTSSMIRRVASDAKAGAASLT